MPVRYSSKPKRKADKYMKPKTKLRAASTIARRHVLLSTFIQLSLLCNRRALFSKRHLSRASANLLTPVPRSRAPPRERREHGECGSGRQMFLVRCRVECRRVVDTEIYLPAYSCSQTFLGPRKAPTPATERVSVHNHHHVAGLNVLRRSQDLF